MKTIFAALLLGLAFNAKADTFLLKDGARLEGDVTGEMDGLVLVQTKYGSLTIKKTDIQEQKTMLPALAPAVSAQVAAALSTAAVVAVSTAPAVLPVSTQAAVAVSTALAVPAEPPAPKLTFATVQPSTTTRLLIYSANGVAVATETFNAAGERLSLEGAIKDGTYTEYYDNGGLKTVKTLANGKVSGTLKAFYPNGAVQIEAYYLAGAKDGAFKYFAEDGKPLMEASYSNDKLNGWKREFGPEGLPKSETYYADDKPADPPKAQPAAAPAKEPESMVTAKTLNLARGERFSFQLNGKYVGKLTLDKTYNIISQEGNIPNGAVKIYSKDEKLEKELVFKKNELVLLRVYNPADDSGSSDTYDSTDAKYEQLVDKLCDAGAQLAHKTIALVPFVELDNKTDSKNANTISERVLTKLINTGKFKVIERNLLDKVLSELKLQASGLADPENAKKLGGLLGAEAIVTGTVAEATHGEIEVNARLINIETAQNLGAARMLLKSMRLEQESREYSFWHNMAVKK